MNAPKISPERKKYLLALLKKNFYKTAWTHNKGIFFRGDAGGFGVGYGKLGKGLYVTWDEGLAKRFAERASEQHGGTPKVKRYKFPKNLKILDWQASPEAIKIREKVGISDFTLGAETPEVSENLTATIKKKGYEGVISDDVADGIVVFDPAKVKEVKK